MSMANIYFDTDEYDLIRKSLEKPIYKEKLRLRAYGIPSENSDTFIEIKKKFNGVVYKRRIKSKYSMAKDYLYNGISDKKYSDALLYFFINKTAYSGMIRYNAKGEFNVPFGRYQKINTSLITKAHSNLLSLAEIYNLDYSEIFDMAKEDDFIFLDPPYDCVFSDYGNEEYKDGFNDQYHIKLANDIKKLNCRVLLVIGRTPLTERLYGDMIIDEYAKTYAVNIRNRFKSSASHILVANYQPIERKLF